MTTLRKFIVSSAVVMAVSSPLVAEDFFDYQLEHYPVTAEACAQTAQELAAHLAAQVPTVEVYGSRCQQDDADHNFNTQTIVLTYVAAQALPLTSTADFTRYMFSGFPKYADCEAARAKEVAAFERETTLGVLFAYCMANPSSGRFIVRLDGTGVAAKRPLMFQAMIPHPLVSTPESVQAEIESHSVYLGAVISSTQVHSDLGGHSIQMLYYATTRLPVELKTPFAFAVKEDCLAAADELRPILGGAAEPALATFCTDSYAPGFVFNILQTTTAAGLHHHAAPNVFADVAACEAGQAQILAFYRDNLHKDVLAGICAREPDAIKLHVFTNGR